MIFPNFMNLTSFKFLMGRLKPSGVGPKIDRGRSYSDGSRLFWIRLIYGGENTRFLSYLFYKMGKRGKHPKIMLLGKGFWLWKKKKHIMVLQMLSLHSGVSKEEVIEKTGFEFTIKSEDQTLAPTEEELHFIRETLDPKGLRNSIFGD